MTIFLLVLAYLSGGQPAPSAGWSAPAIMVRVALLADDDFETRLAAEDWLLRAGPKAHRVLVAVANSRDPEVAHRANRVLRQTLDAVDYGTNGATAPRLVDAAGPRSWVYSPDGTHGGLYLPDAGPALDRAERYGRQVLADRGETADTPGTKSMTDPLCGPVQSAATVRYFRDLQLAGVSRDLIKAMAAALDEATQDDEGGP